MSEETPDQPFVPNCARCVYYGEVGINDAGYKAQFLMRPRRGIGSDEAEKSNVTWRVGVCCNPGLPSITLIGDCRQFGAECGPMGAWYEERQIT